MEEIKKKLDRLVEWVFFQYGTLRFRKEIARLKRGECPFCGTKIDHTKMSTKIEKIMYQKTGLCKKCQKGLYE
jgi:hypothetical protein